MDYVLEAHEISKTYPGVVALDRFSLTCRPGEVHAILGENGSGKSTLMKIASGVIQPDTGRITIAGQPLTRADAGLARRLGLATVYQDDSLVRELTVAENLLLGAPQGAVPFAGRNAWAASIIAPYQIDINPAAKVGDLTPAHRQFVEIIKALLPQPRVLLLDEPTSTLDQEGVRQLVAIIRQLQARGTGLLYVSHRLPEILELADRVTILRDGVHQGTFDITPDLSEHDLVSRMIGRDVESEYPPKPAGPPGRALLRVTGLNGAQFHDLSFIVRAGEIVGFAGAEGNGQREALRALGGLEASWGQVQCQDCPVDLVSPRKAARGGMVFLSADRAGETIYPDLSVQKNMVVSRFAQFIRRGLVASGPECDLARGMKQDFNLVAASLSVPVNSLSGGNQQKAVLARIFGTKAPVVLIDEPTQGVDAGARQEIYKSIRANLGDDQCCVVNSSDAQELAGICDRVLVFSRGTIVAELTGDAITENAIVSTFLTHRAHRSEKPQTERSGILDLIAGGAATWWLPMVCLAVLTLLLGGYAASQNAKFLSAINIRHTLLALAPIALVSMAQLLVLLVRGIDVSVGSLMSLTVVAASFVIAGGGTLWLLIGVLACLAMGLAVGLINGGLVRYARINAVITTIAMLSVLQGAALLARPIPAGLIAPEFAALLRFRLGMIPVSAILLVALAVLGDLWLHRSASGLATRAVGFREEAARRNGINVNRVQIRAYVLASVLTVAAGLFLGSEVGVGHPTVGANYALMSIAAAVLGGAALSGGYGSFIGTLMGALFFTVMMNVMSLLGLSTAFGLLVSGLMTMLAIFLYSGLGELRAQLRRLRPGRSTPVATVN